MASLLLSLRTSIMLCRLLTVLFHAFCHQLVGAEAAAAAASFVGCNVLSTTNGKLLAATSKRFNRNDAPDTSK